MNEFMTVALEFVRERASQALQAEYLDDELLELAAHFFALGCRIPTETGSAPLHAPEPGDPGSLRETLHRLAELRSATPADLFWSLVGALQSIEQELAWNDDGGLALASSTPLQGPAELRLSGEVVHWIRPSAEWRSLRRRRTEWGGARDGPPGPAPNPIFSLERLALHWNADPRQPRVLPPKRSAERFNRLLDSSYKNQRFRIALCPLPRECRPHFDVLDDGRLFRAKHESSIYGWDALKPHLTALLEAAGRERIHLLALPELMGDGRVEEHVLTELHRSSSELPWAVVAGSFHRWPDGRPPEHRPPVNRAVLWSRPDIPVLQHDKRGRFRVSRRQYKAVQPLCFPDGPNPLPPEVDELVEHIEHDAGFHVLDTALGRFVLVICTDCIAKDTTALVSLVEALLPDFVFIVSMTPESELFEGFMENLSRRRIASFFVNAACICGPGNVLAAVDLGLYEPPGAPATRFRWRSVPEGEDKVEQRCYGPDVEDKDEKARRKDWHEPGTEDPGAWLLHQHGEPVALVIDLEPHFAWAPDKP